MRIKKSDLNRKIERQESRIDRLVGMLAKKGFYDKLKKLDQSIFDDEPPHLRWAALEEDGGVYLFAKKPFIDLCKWAAGVDEVEVYVGDDYNYDTTDWQNSLIERDTAKEPAEVDLSSELTGSDYFYSNITSALLESGSKLVVCFVSDTSELKALSNKRIEVITSLDTSFNDSDGYGWQYAVPINNQGEPLTASEVGL